jgi:hypothetical protein
MATSVIQGDCHFSGNVTFGGQVTLPTGAVTAAKVAAGAKVEASKIQQRGAGIAWNYLNSNDPAATKTFPVHVVFGATGTLVGFQAGCVVPCVGTATVTVDLRKNGSTVLSAVITLDSSQTARQQVSAAINNAAVAVGDVLEVVVTASAGTGTLGQGLFGVLVIDEDPL